MVRAHWTASYGNNTPMPSTYLYRAEAAEADRLSLIADNTALEQRLNKALQSREDHFALEKEWEQQQQELREAKADAERLAEALRDLFYCTAIRETGKCWQCEGKAKTALAAHDAAARASAETERSER
jgi:hypothetical protein